MNNTAKASSSFNRARQVPVNDALDSVRAGLSRADDERALAYEQLAIFQRAKSNLLTRHERLLALKLGEDAPRVVALKGQREATLAEIRHLEVAHTVAATPQPQPGPAGYAIHGYIRDPNLEPVAQVRLVVFDAAGKPRSDFKPATSDRRGYFTLETERLLDTSPPPTDEGEAPSGSVQLELRAFQGQRPPLQIVETSIVATPGTSHFADLVTDATGSSTEKPGTASKKPASPSGNVRGRLKDLTARMRAKPQAATSGKSRATKPARAASRAKPKPKGAASRRKKS